MIQQSGANVNSPQMRRAGRDLLSLALMDARNRSLLWCAAFEAAPAPSASAEFEPPLWLIGHAAWFQESWIARNVQRQRGTRCDPRVIRLSSIDPQADGLYDFVATSRAERWARGAPTALRSYLADTVEVMLELLESVDDSDDALYFYRLALFHEDQCAEALAEVAQVLGISPPAGLVQPLANGAGRAPLLYPATRCQLGSPADHGGFLFDNETSAHEVPVPEFEIDAQPVSWSQYTEFAEDGGYDEPAWWSPAGWQWLQGDGRRVPRHVEQMRAGVLQRRFGAALRVPLAQPVVHVTAHEAEAWCRWAGRRLPAEVEWDIAARSGASRGFAWGGVREWMSGGFHPYPGFVPGPWAAYSQRAFGTHRVLRGASAATHPRLREPALRGFALPAQDLGFTGFRSCAL